MSIQEATQCGSIIVAPPEALLLRVPARAATDTKRRVDQAGDVETRGGPRTCSEQCRAVGNTVGRATQLHVDAPSGADEVLGTTTTLERPSIGAKYLAEQVLGVVLQMDNAERVSKGILLVVRDKGERASPGNV